MINSVQDIQEFVLNNSFKKFLFCAEEPPISILEQKIFSRSCLMMLR